MIRPERRGFRPIFLLPLALLILFLANIGAYFYTDVLWFQEVGLSSVLWKSIRTQLGVGFVGGLFVAALLWVNLTVAARVAPTYVTRVGIADPVARYRELAEPYLRLLRVGVSLLFGLLSGIVASGQWQNFLMWLHGGDFGVRDPQFGRDVGFYVFDLPFVLAVLDEIWGALVLTVLLTAAAHYFYGSIRPQFGLRGVTSAALAHVSVLLGLLALVKAAQYWVGTYELNFSPRGVVTGASYTDVHAQLPALRLLAVISVISAVLFLVNIRVRRLSLPLAAVGIWVMTAVLAGGLWPMVVQRFSVEPQEPQRERPYIARNIAATRAAFGLSDVETRPYPARAELESSDVRANRDVLQNVRLWDPGVLQQAYSQLQAIRTYYKFPDIDIDRYEVDGEQRQVLLAARELSIEDLPDTSRKWANLHLQFTHGFGVVASLANATTTAGQPSFLVKDVPGTVIDGAEVLETEQPRIYYGEAFDDDEYSIVNSDQQELDFATDEGVQRSSYEGEGGIVLGGLPKRLLFALREGDTNLVLSGLINTDSKILIYRNVRDRVARAAPFLSLDHDPYPAVVDGRLVWIVDAYTSTRWYPYSQRYDSGAITGTGSRTLTDDVNYVRNSVKVVVDAYDGTMTFYVIDPNDPLVAAWRKVFPELFATEEPSADLAAHFRYPEDLFRLQSEVYRAYHISDALDFYSREDEWALAEQPPNDAAGELGTADTTTSGSGAELPPTYLLFQLPGETNQEFVLTRPYTPRARRNMIAFLAARSDPGVYGELVNLQFPRQITTQGPLQVHNLINQDVEISREISLLDVEGSRVSFGSLVILPIEESILYVQPLFIIADAQDGGIPELKKVVMVLGERVVMEATFDEALAALFGETDDGAVAPIEEEPREEPGDEPPADARLQELVQRAARLYERAQQALADGDFQTYGALIEQLGRVLEQAEAARS